MWKQILAFISPQLECLRLRRKNKSTKQVMVTMSMVVKNELLSGMVGIQTGTTTWKSLWRLLKRVQIDLPLDPVITYFQECNQRIYISI